MITAIVPAAGEGRRLGAPGPKALAPLLGRPLISYVLTAIMPSADHLVVVLRPGEEKRFEDALGRVGWSKPVTMAVQPTPTGSADAVAAGVHLAPHSVGCVVVWADQVGLSSRTVARVVEELKGGTADLVLPLIDMANPYVWIELTRGGVIERVGRARDGDVPPDRGRADLGLFGVHPDAVLRCIDEEFAAERRDDRERDFVYVLPRLSRTRGVVIVPVDDESEAVAVNTTDDLAHAESVLGGRR
jgi:CTP:molybdopterin cytidylyltransferase MocA